MAYHMRDMRLAKRRSSKRCLARRKDERAPGESLGVSIGTGVLMFALLALMYVDMVLLVPVK